MQDAKGRGLAVGEVLGLWGSPEAPRLQTAVSARLATARSASSGLGQDPATFKASEGRTPPSR